ncbi:MAG: cytochrome d ubiquinol oxidase subunit II [Polyangiaceae bacterium]
MLSRTWRHRRSDLLDLLCAVGRIFFLRVPRALRHGHGHGRDARDDPARAREFRAYPVAWVIVGLNVLAVANVPRALHHGRPGWAFVSTGALVAALAFLLAMAIFPNLVFDPWHPERSLTVAKAASSDDTLRLMRVIAFMGLPFIATYTFIVYWVFRGKTKLDTFSY